MANTNDLKSIEKEIKEIFCQNNKLKAPFSKEDIKTIFLQVEPDVVGYDPINGYLHVGEITVSGFDGNQSKNKNFHNGAARKLAEIFCKFYIIKFCDSASIIANINKKFPEYKVKNIHCHFIIPGGAKFIQALGYRKKLFDTGVMSLDEIALPTELIEKIRKNLSRSRNEIMVGKS